MKYTKIHTKESFFSTFYIFFLIFGDNMFQTKKRYTLLLHSYRKTIPEIISRVSAKISAFSWTKMGFRRSEVQRSSHKFVPPVFCSLAVSLFLLFLSPLFIVVVG